MKTLSRPCRHGCHLWKPHGKGQLVCQSCGEVLDLEEPVTPLLDWKSCDLSAEEIVQAKRLMKRRALDA